MELAREKGFHFWGLPLLPKTPKKYTKL